MKLAAMLMLPLAACSLGGNSDDDGIKPTGTGTTRSFAASGFTSVGLGGSDEVDVRVGPGFSVRAEGPSDVLDDLKIRLHGDSLDIGRKDHHGGTWIRGKAKVFVTLPRITGANVGGSGTLQVDHVRGGDFSGNVGGSGTLSLAAVQADKAEFAIGGSGNIQAAGNARSLKVSIGGSGAFRGAGFRASQAEVSTAGSGSVTAVVNGSAKVTSVGSGSVDLGPQAKCSVTKMGSGSVRCGG